MTNLSRETIHYLSQLSRIACSEKEEQALLHDLKQILDYMEQLQELNTEGVAPCHTVLEQLSKTPLRKDSPKATLSQKKFLENAPQKTGGFVRVPTTVHKAGKNELNEEQF